VTDAPRNDPSLVGASLRHTSAVTAMRARQNFRAAIPAGLIGALLGAVVWAAFVYFTHVKLGAVAIFVGLLVGNTIRFAGQGVDQGFGAFGAACAAFSWVLGTLLCDVAFLAHNSGMTLGATLGQLGLAGTMSLGIKRATLMDIFFLGITLWEGYRFPFRYKI
jgi:hypothetical protein